MPPRMTTSAIGDAAISSRKFTPAARAIATSFLGDGFIRMMTDASGVRMKSIAAGMCAATIIASCPAPLDIIIAGTPVRSTRATSIATSEPIHHGGTVDRSGRPVERQSSTRGDLVRQSIEGDRRLPPGADRRRGARQGSRDSGQAMTFGAPGVDLDSACRCDESSACGARMLRRRQSIPPHLLAHHDGRPSGSSPRDPRHR